MKILPSSKCISYFDDIILIYLTSSSKCLRIFTIENATVKCWNGFSMNTAQQRSVIIQNHIRKRDNWALSTIEGRFWDIANNPEIATIFRLTRDEFMLLLSEEI